MCHDLEMIRFWSHYAAMLREQATVCDSGDRLSKLRAARFADEYVISLQTHLERSTASVESPKAST